MLRIPPQRPSPPPSWAPYPAWLGSASLGFVLLAVFLTSPALASAQSFNVVVQIAVDEQGPVVSERWVAEQLAQANAIYAPAGVSFTARSEQNPVLQSQVVTRIDRHRLGPAVDVGSGEIHVFVVRSLADIDVANRVLRGVHWRSRRGGSARHYVILSSIAGSSVLAHELGHFFGNAHSPTPGNVMSYARGEGRPFLDDAQLRQIRRFARRFVASGELRTVREHKGKT